MSIGELIAKYNNGEKSQDLELVLVNHPDTPKEILKQLASSNDLEIAEAASLHVNLAGEIKEGWYELAENLISQKDLGQNDLLIYELLEFAPIPDYFINEWIPWKQIAKGIENSNMPVLWRDRLLSRLADIDSVDARIWVAACEHTSLEILKKLARDADIKVRTVISLQPSFSPEWFEPIKNYLEEEITSFKLFINYLENNCDYLIVFCLLQLLAKNKDVNIRKRSVAHFLVPIKILKKLAIDPDSDIRQSIAHHISTPSYIREKLSKDKNFEVKKAVAECVYTPKYIREKLAIDENDEIRETIKKNIYFHGEELELPSYTKILQEFTKNQKLFVNWSLNDNSDRLISSEQLLKKLAEDRTSDTSNYRSHLSEAMDTPSDILEKLISSPEIYIRYSLAKRSDLRFDLSEKLWEELVIDPEKNKIYKYSSEKYGYYVLSPVNLAEEEEALPFIIKNYIESCNAFSRFIFLTHPLVAYYLFKKYIKSIFWLDRYALAINPATPKNIRQILTQDINIIVRAAAKCNGSLPQFSSNRIIPKNKTDNQNLLATLTVLAKQLQRDRLSSDWHYQETYETILWEVESKQDLSFADFMIHQEILTQISLDKFFQGFQKQASRQCIRKQFHSPLIEPSITAESLDRCKMLRQWLHDNCETIETYQINFYKQENIFQIVVAQTKDGNWLGISPLIGYWSDYLHDKYSKPKETKTIIKSLEPILNDLNPSIRFRASGVKEFGRGTVYEIERSRNCLIEKLLCSANFIQEIEAKVNQFFRLYLTNFKAYRIGYWFSSNSYYHEIYTIGKTPQEDWLVLNTQIFSYP